MSVRLITLLVAAAMSAVAGPAAADPWYEHYAGAEQALAEEDWALAVQELNEALARKADSGARVRTYGMNVIAYFPYFKLGTAYYYLGQHDAALQAFETEARLGAIAENDTANAELDRFRTLAMDARTTAVAEQQQRIRRTVTESLNNAEILASEGLLVEAMDAVDRALAVAPDDEQAQGVMQSLRQQYAESQRQQDESNRILRLIGDGRARLAERRYSEASSLFRQALDLSPDPDVEALLETAQERLLGNLDAAARGDSVLTVSTRLAEVLMLESEGDFAGALEQLQAILALQPDDPEARAIQARLVQARNAAEAELERQAAIDQLLADAASQFDAGATAAALSAANRVLALDPGNGAALEHIAMAYAVISGELLGTRSRGNIPPAIRFVDLRSEQDGGLLAQSIRVPEFRLDGVVLDDSPVRVAVLDARGQVLGSWSDSQPLGELYVGEFHFEATLEPGASTFRLVATDSDDLSSGSEYAVIYVRPFFRAPWFYGLLLALVVVLAGAGLWRQHLRRVELRQRRFNPYVAGAPVLDDEMFFGRRELVDRILQTIHNNSLLIFGERRIGKTSIQHQVKKRLRELDDPNYLFYPVYVDLQGTPETRFFQTIAEDIVHELGPELDELPPDIDISDPYSFRDFVRDVRAILKALEAETTRTVKLVLLIDEVDELNEYDPRINQKLRSLFMKNFAENLVAIVSGVEIKKRWEREGSPWYNFFEEIEVKPFEAQEARELIERPIGKVFKLDGGVVDEIYSLTAGRPYLIQKICIALVSRMHEQRRSRITIDDVRAVADSGSVRTVAGADSPVRPLAAAE